MMLSLFNLTNMGGSKRFGQPWAPKTQRCMVGRDVNPLTQTSAAVNLKRDLVRADGADTIFTSNQIFSAAKTAALQGHNLKNFRHVDTSDPEGLKAAESNALYRSDKHMVTFDKNTLTVFEKNDKGEWEETQSVFAKEDIRLSWGGNGSPTIKTGSEAVSSKGVLKAEGVNEILIRVSGRDVEASGGTVVLNLSRQKGNFSGGDGVTYLGVYDELSTIAGGTGEMRYAGYFNGTEISQAAGTGTFSGLFENITIDGGNEGNTFSGYFSQSTINGGNGKNVFSGMFVSGTNVLGGDSEDRFVGRFVETVLEGGGGNDTFGQGLNLNGSSYVLTDDDRNYTGLHSDFVDSTITSDTGNNTLNGMVTGGTVNFGAGNDTIRGAFIETEIKAGEGNDNISAMYSEQSSFLTGTGDDFVFLATSRNSSVTTGEGTNSVSMGYNPGVSTAESGTGLGGDAVLSNTSFSTPEEYRSRLVGLRFGELEANSINAAAGQNAIHVNNGSGTQSVYAGNRFEEQPEETPAELEKTNPGSEPKTGAGIAQESIAEAAQDTRDMMSSLPETKAQAPTDKQMRFALERYALISGNGPAKPDGPAVSVNTGVGESIDLQYNYRTRREFSEPQGLMAHYTRRFNGYSSTMR